MLIRETRGGLLLAEETAAPLEIRAALKRVHPDLILGQEVDQRWSRFVWKVLIRQGDRPAVWLFDWREDPSDPSSEPRPLTFEIVDEAKLMQRGSRRVVLDPVRANDAMIEEAEREARELAEDLAREANARRGRLPAFHRSRGLYLSRRKGA